MVKDWKGVHESLHAACAWTDQGSGVKSHHHRFDFPRKYRQDDEMLEGT